VSRFIAAFEDTDEAFRSVLHPEIEWYPIEENRTPTRGIEAALRNRNQWLDTWEEHHLAVEEAIEAGDDVVLAIHIRARGRGSGVQGDIRFYAQFRVRDGRVAYIYDHEDRSAALEAAGLRDRFRRPPRRSGWWPEHRPRRSGGPSPSAADESRPQIRPGRSGFPLADAEDHYVATCHEVG
jgi:hypothetical protein